MDSSVIKSTNREPPIISLKFPSNAEAIEAIIYDIASYDLYVHFNDKQQADNILKATDPATQKNWDKKSPGSRRKCGIKNHKV